MYSVESKQICYLDNTHIHAQTVDQTEDGEIVSHRKIDLEKRLVYFHDGQSIEIHDLTLGDTWEAYPPLKMPEVTKSAFKSLNEMEQTYELVNEYENDFMRENFVLKKTDMLTDIQIKALKLDYTYHDICYMILQKQTYKRGILIGNTQSFISNEIQKDDHSLIILIDDVFK